jgi:hypothetical protein
MTAAIWEPTLLAYSAALDDHRSALQAVELDIDIQVPIAPTFVAPVDVPPMPDEYVPWARTLLETTDGLIEMAKQLATRSELRRGQRAQRPQPVLLAVGAGVGESTLDALL